MAIKQANSLQGNLRRALLGSALAHALLLLPAPWSAGGGAPGKPLQVRISPAVTPTAAPAPAKPIPSPPAPPLTQASKNALPKASTAKMAQAPAAATSPNNNEADGLDEADLGLYRLSLARGMRRQSPLFPPGPAGRAVFRLHLDGRGQPEHIEQLASSGQENRDQQAQALLLATARHSPLPASLSGRRLRVDLTLDFPGD